LVGWVESGGIGVLDVERWAELRRGHFVRGVSIKELARRVGVDRNTVRRALRATSRRFVAAQLGFRSWIVS
jgi:lambda repressor-like predicted transcriptional regulator